MARNADQIHAIAQKIIQRPANRKMSAGDTSYLSTCSRLIHKELEEYYSPSGVTPPNSETIRGWFYTGCPDWAIAILTHTTSRECAATR